MRLMEFDAPATDLALARIVGVSRQAITNMRLDGRISGATMGELLRSYCDRLRQRQPATTDGSPDIERARLLREQTVAMRLRNAEMRGQFAPVEVLTDTLAAVVGVLAAGLDALPATLRAACPDIRPEHLAVVLQVVANARAALLRSGSRLADDAGDEAAA